MASCCAYVHPPLPHPRSGGEDDAAAAAAAAAKLEEAAQQQAALDDSEARRRARERAYATGARLAAERARAAAEAELAAMEAAARASKQREILSGDFVRFILRLAIFFSLESQDPPVASSLSALPLRGGPCSCEWFVVTRSARF